MQKHVKIYLKENGYTEADRDQIPCELSCGNIAVDVHHINAKGMGGSKTKDYNGNLIALCRPCHELAHNTKHKYIYEKIAERRINANNRD